MAPAVLRNLTLILCLLLPALAPAETLKAVFEAAGPRDGYDKYLELEMGKVYTGGLQIGPSLIPNTESMSDHPGSDVRIVGNGAILDLAGEQLCISYCLNRLDIDNCIVINGTLRYRGQTLLGTDLRPPGDRCAT